MKEIILNTLRMYSITLIIPMASTFLLSVVSIMGFEIVDGFFGALRGLWIGYYIDGTLLGPPAYRIQLGVLFIFFVLSLFNSVKNYD